MQPEQGPSDTAISEGFTLSLSKLSEPNITTDVVNWTTALYAQPDATTSNFSITATQDKPTVMASQLQRQMSEMELEGQKEERSLYMFPHEEGAEVEAVETATEDAAAILNLEGNEQTAASQTGVRLDTVTVAGEENEEAALTEEEKVDHSQSEDNVDGEVDFEPEDDVATKSETVEEEVQQDSKTEEEEEQQQQSDSQAEEEKEQSAFDSQAEEEKDAVDSQSEEEEEQGAAEPHTEEEEEDAVGSQSEEEEEQGAAESHTEEDEDAVGSQSEEEEVPSDSQSHREAEEAVDSQTEDAQIDSLHASKVALQLSGDEEGIVNNRRELEDPAEMGLSDSKPEDEHGEEPLGEEDVEQPSAHQEHISKRAHCSEGGLIVPVAEPERDLADVTDASKDIFDFKQKLFIIRNGVTSNVTKKKTSLKCFQAFNFLN